MYRLPLLVGALVLMMAPIARAEYQFRFEQFDESGATVEQAGWRCTDAQMKADSCTQGILLDIGGRPEPIDMQFRDDGGILRLTMSSGAWLVATTSAKPLIFDRRGTIASTIDAWETE